MDTKSGGSVAGEGRKMSDKPMGRLDCWPLRHRWTKWETFESGQVMRSGDSTAKILGEKPAIVGVYEYQRRTCADCGKSQLREAEA